MTENLVSAMHPELQDRYMQLKDIINSFSYNSFFSDDNFFPNRKTL